MSVRWSVSHEAPGSLRCLLHLAPEHSPKLPPRAGGERPPRPRRAPAGPCAIGWSGRCGRLRPLTGRPRLAPAHAVAPNRRDAPNAAPEGSRSPSCAGRGCMASACIAGRLTRGRRSSARASRGRARRDVPENTEPGKRPPVQASHEQHAAHHKNERDQPDLQLPDPKGADGRQRDLLSAEPDRPPDLVQPVAAGCRCGCRSSFATRRRAPAAAGGAQDRGRARASSVVERLLRPVGAARSGSLDRPPPPCPWVRVVHDLAINNDLAHRVRGRRGPAGQCYRSHCCSAQSFQL